MFYNFRLYEITKSNHRHHTTNRWCCPKRSTTNCAGQRPTRQDLANILPQRATYIVIRFTLCYTWVAGRSNVNAVKQQWNYWDELMHTGPEWDGIVHELFLYFYKPDESAFVVKFMILNTKFIFSFSIFLT